MTEQHVHAQGSVPGPIARPRFSLNLYMNSDQRDLLRALAGRYSTSVSKLVWVAALLVHRYGDELIKPSPVHGGWPLLKDEQKGA